MINERTTNTSNVGCQYFVERMFHAVSYTYNAVSFIVVAVFFIVYGRIYALYDFSLLIFSHATIWCKHVFAFLQVVL